MCILTELFGGILVDQKGWITLLIASLEIIIMIISFFIIYKSNSFREWFYADGVKLRKVLICFIFIL